MGDEEAEVSRGPVVPAEHRTLTRAFLDKGSLAEGLLSGALQVLATSAARFVLWAGTMRSQACKFVMAQRELSPLRSRGEIGGSRWDPQCNAPTTALTPLRLKRTDH